MKDALVNSNSLTPLPAYTDIRITNQMTSSATAKNRERMAAYFAGIMTDRVDPHFRAGQIRFDAERCEAVLRWASYDEHVAIAWAITMGFEPRRAASLALTGFIQAFQLNRPHRALSDDRRTFHLEDRLIFLENQDEWFIASAELPSRVIYEGDYWCMGMRPIGDTLQHLCEGEPFSIEADGLPSLFEHGKPKNLLRLLQADPAANAQPSPKEIAWEKETWALLNNHESRWVSKLRLVDAMSDSSPPPSS